MTEQQQQELAKFEGWAIVQQMGHKTVAGYVTTVYFGNVAMLRVVQQEGPEVELTTERDEWVDGHYLYAGSKVRVYRPRAEQYVAVSSLYAFTPCTEEEANKSQPKHVEILERADRKAVVAAQEEDVTGYYEKPEEDDEDGPF